MDENGPKLAKMRLRKSHDLWKSTSFHHNIFGAKIVIFADMFVMNGFELLFLCVGNRFP